MNRDIARLRDVVAGVVQLLAGRGLKVTQQGTRAFVTTDKRTGQPVRVNIPHIPDNATPEFLMAIQGFIDHEVGHILDTDAIEQGKFHDRVCRERGPQVGAQIYNLWNVCEDTYIERRMTERFKGTGYNLERLHEFFVKEITQPAIDDAMATGNREKLFGFLIVPMARAWAGQAVFQRYMADKWVLVENEVRKIGALKDRFPKLKSTLDCTILAEELYDALYAKREEKGDGGDGESCEKGEPGKSKTEKPSKSKPKAGDKTKGEEGSVGAESEAQDDATETDKKGKSGKGKTDKKEDRDDAEADAGDKDQPAAGDADEDEGKASSGEGDADAGEKEESDRPGGDGESSASDDAEGDDEKDSDAKGDGGSDEAEDSDEEGSEKGKGKVEDDDGVREDEGDRDGSGSTNGEELEGADGPKDLWVASAGDEDGESAAGEEIDGDSLADTPIILEGMKTFEEAIAEKVSEDALELAREAEYIIYSKDFDIVEKYEPSRSYSDSLLQRLEDQTRHMVGVMQKDIERMMAARNQSYFVPGYRSGKVNPTALARLRVGDDRVFRRKHEVVTKDVEVGLLVDCSGSMGGDRIEIAMASAYALSQTLERVGIKHEVLGFTTKGARLPVPVEELNAEQRRIGKSFSRVEPLWIPIFKGFDERHTPVVRKRFADVAENMNLANNVDGECVEVAALRLLNRNTKRRVLIVLSDGEPCAAGDMYAQAVHLGRVVEQVNKAGVETIGIGIQTSSVKRFYPKHVVLRDLEALPKEVMSQLRGILAA